MKVALVASANEQPTGVDRYAAGLTAALRALGIDVRLVERRRREVRVGRARLGGNASLWAAHLARRPRGVDIVHALDPSVASRASDVVTVHDLIPERYPEWYLTSTRARLDWMFSRTVVTRGRARIVTNTETTRADVIARWHVADARVRVTPLGVDAARFAPTTDSSTRLLPGATNLVYLGDDNPRKNLALAIEAAAKLSGRVRVVRVGPTRQPAAPYRARAQALGVDLVEPGFLSDDEIRRVFSHASVFIWPTVAEGFGFPPLEAMACGAPVVALDTPVNRETLGAFARYHANDPVAMVEAIEATLRARPSAERLRAYAATFTWERCARATLQAYEEVARA